MSSTGLYVVHHHAHAPGPLVVVVHGAPDRSKNLAKAIHHLSDLHVVAYDRRGYGKSLHAEPARATWDDHVEDLMAVIGEQPAIVVGQSAGGAISMMAASKYPERFLALGAWEPPAGWHDWWLENIEWAGPEEFEHYGSDPAQLGEHFNRRILGDERWEGLPERTRELLRAEGTAFYDDMMSQMRRPFDVEDVHVPLVVGCGSLTPEPLQNAARELCRRLNGEWFYGEGANHFAHTDQPATWAELVRRTVALAARQPGRGGRG